MISNQKDKDNPKPAIYVKNQFNRDSGIEIFSINDCRKYMVQTKQDTADAFVLTNLILSNHSLFYG